MKKLIFIILLSVLMTGCASKKIITTTHERDSIFITHDSIVYRETIRIDTHRIEADHAYVEALFECDSLGQVKMREITRLENGLRATANISFRDGVLSVECHCDSMEIYSIFKSRYEREVSSSVTEVTTEDTSEKLIVRSPWWLRFWWIWLIVAAIGFIAYKKFLS